MTRLTEIIPIAFNRHNQLINHCARSWWSLWGRREIGSRTYSRYRPLPAGYGVRPLRESRGSERPYRRQAFPDDSWGETIDRRRKTRTAVLYDGVRGRNTRKPEERLRVSSQVNLSVNTFKFEFVVIKQQIYYFREILYNY